MLKNSAKGKSLFFPLTHEMGERVRERGMVKLATNLAYNALNIPHHLIVPEPQNRITKILQPYGTAVVILYQHPMLPAIDFNNQFPRRAGEVGKIIADGKLPAETDTQLICAQLRSEFAFRIGGVIA